MGWHEWPLILFTVLAQTAVGAFCWCFAALTLGGLDDAGRARLQRAMLAVWLLAAAGFALSALHLGSPWRGINATFRFLRAPLSNEIVFGSAFVAAGFAGWWAQRRGIGSPGLRQGLLWLTLVLCLAFLASMTAFYLMPTVPTWNTPLTPAAFLLTATIGGSIVAATLFSAAGIEQPRWLREGPVKLAALAVAAAVLVTLAQSASLPAIHSSIHEAALLTPDYGALMGLRFVLLFTVLGLWLRGVWHGRTLAVGTGASYAVVLLLGEMVGRGVFYNLHMTVGLR